jgi:1-pyrroline-5-carboxylate dehydrogenase
MMGNVVLWKPSDSQVFSNYYRSIEAGVPDGVINVVLDALMVLIPFLQVVILQDCTLQDLLMYLKIFGQGTNIHHYKTYPRIVGETGGKDFIIAHSSANPKQVATGIVRGAFEFQGQNVQQLQELMFPQVCGQL